MKKVYNIASNAGMNPNQFCKIRNGCFANDVVHDPYASSSLTASSSSSDTSTNNNNNNGAPTNPFLRKIMASTRISELLGVEPVFAEKQSLLQQQQQRSNTINTPSSSSDNNYDDHNNNKRHW